MSWVAGLPGPVAVTYEAGPTGFGLARAMTAAGIRCEVAAPSKLHRPAGDRVKTDAKDAVLLARLLRMDEIVSVRVPSVDRGGRPGPGPGPRGRPRRPDAGPAPGLEAAAASRPRLLRRQRLDRHARRRGCARSGSTSPAPGPPTRPTSRRSMFAVARRDRLDAAIAAMAADSEFTAVTRRLCCLRGISTLTGFALAVEIGDWDRFTGASIGAYLGLVPSEHSSGESRRQGGITKTGNTHARRLLVEAAWHHKPRYTVGKPCSRPAGTRPPQPPGHVATPATSGCTTAGSATPPGTRSTPSPTPPSPASWPAGAGPWPPWSSRSPSRLGLRSGRRQREEPTRDSTVSHRAQARDARPQTRGALPPNSRPAVTNPRISVSTARREDTLRPARRRPNRGAADPDPAAPHPAP